MNIIDVDVLQVDVLDQYPLSAASVVIFGGTAAAGKETVFQQGASNLTITLGDDFWDEGLGEDTTASTDLLAALKVFPGAWTGGQEQTITVNGQPVRTPTGWNALIQPTLNYTHLTRASDTMVVVQLPHFPCYDLLYPEVLTLSVPPTAVQTRRAVLEAEPLWIDPDGFRSAARVTPPRWGSVWAPPNEESRNCTHTRFTWRAPPHDGHTPLTHYRLEWRALPAAGFIGPDPGWAASVVEESEPLGTTRGDAGPLTPGVQYEVRVRAYSRGHHGPPCVPLRGDDGAPRRFFAGWRARGAHAWPRQTHPPTRPPARPPARPPCRSRRARHAIGRSGCSLRTRGHSLAPEAPLRTHSAPEAPTHTPRHAITPAHPTPSGEPTASPLSPAPASAAPSRAVPT